MHACTVVCLFVFVLLLGCLVGSVQALAAILQGLPLFNIPRPSRCACLLPPAEKATYACSKKNLFLLKVLLQFLPERGGQMSLFGRGMSPLGQAKSPFRLHPDFAKQQQSQKCTEAKDVPFAQEPLAQTAQKCMLRAQVHHHLQAMGQNTH